MYAAAFLLLQAAALDHSAWDALLREYVNEQHQVSYQRLKAAGLAPLDEYLTRLAKPWPKGMAAEEEKAALINAYNALTVRWVLRHYPVASIWKTKRPFREARHTVNGEQISLDAVETRLRKMGDPRIHAALVCAARGCPPLRREAYTATRLNQQLDANTREWLANTALNTFDPGSRKAEISMIFEWYRADFLERGGTVEAFLARHGPRPAAGLLGKGGWKLSHKGYRWGLNDSGPLGEDYSGAAFYWDALRNR